jgi:hypothetical protein
MKSLEPKPNAFRKSPIYGINKPKSSKTSASVLGSYKKPNFDSFMDMPPERSYDAPSRGIKSFNPYLKRA